MSEESKDSRKVLFDWHIDGDFYKPRVSVYEDGSITICVNSSCIGHPIENWFNLQKRIDELEKENMKLRYFEEEKDRDETEREIVKVSEERNKWRETAKILYDLLLQQHSDSERDVMKIKEIFRRAKW